MAKSKYDRRKIERKGRFAEWFAIVILLLKGYHILAHRWKCKAGEIDIVAMKRNTLVFVEVKYRKSHALALEAVTNINRRRIERAADIYVQNKKLTPLPKYRFDIVTISGFQWRHHQNAWRSGD